MKNQLLLVSCLGILLFAPVAAAAPEAGFCAYYTHIKSEEPFERFSRTGDHADIAVKFGTPDGRLVFWRGSSYLPYWETAKGRWYLDEIVSRKGDGTDRRPDNVNALSHVALIERAPQRVVVSWRYLPKFTAGNPYKGLDATKFVEEVFVVEPSGRITRTIKQGTPKIDDWNDPLNQTVQVVQLAADGVKEVSRTAAAHSPAAGPVAGSPVKPRPKVAPVREWRFDEAAGDEAVESVTGTKCPIAGHKSLWRRGVSGTCLQFDDYNTTVALPVEKSPPIKDAITLAAWVVIGAYPWNWCPIVHQGDDDGYFLGVDGHAHAGFKLKLGGARLELVSTEKLDRFRWYHVAGTYDRGDGTMRLLIDGKEVAKKTVGAEDITTAAAPIQIGKGNPRRPVDPVRANTFSAPYAFDGLIDEVRIYDKALSAGQLADLCAAFRPDSADLDKPDMDRRSLPKFDTGGRFGAHYTRLKFYDIWDNLWRFGQYPDVVVGFDQQPTHFVFWRGTGYIAMIVNEKDHWYSNEFNETWGRSGGRGCQEPMSDKESFFNHVRVIENTPARVVLQWRYPLVDVFHTIANLDTKTGWGDWADWYFTIYPDGVAAKSMHLWTAGPRNHEFQESMAIMGPNQHPEQVLQTSPALVLADLQGNVAQYSWAKGLPGVDYRNKKIHIVRYRADYHAFTIGDFLRGNVYSGEQTPYAVFPSWNHWPVAQMPSDGRYASFPDRAAHSSLTHVFMPNHREATGDRPFYSKLLLEGMTDRSAKDLVPLARSWLQPPAIAAAADCTSAGYDPAQRAYLLDATGPAPSLHIEASPEHPIVNPCFVVRKWNRGNEAKLLIDGQPAAPSPKVRQGIVRDGDGREMLVVWLQLERTGPTAFTLDGK